MMEHNQTGLGKPFMRAALFVLLTIGLAGCGVYTLNPAGKSAIKSITVEQIENKTTEFGLTDRLTEFVIDAFIKEGSMKVVPEGMGDASLIAILNRYQKLPAKFDENDQVEEYKIVLDLQVTLKNPKDDSEIWTEHMIQEGLYNASSQTEEDGQRAAGNRLVEAILNRTTKSW
ncbi:MAG: hypothetical protein IPH75_00180 [bacterium]|nr:hypothetical protein [bacterium]